MCIRDSQNGVTKLINVKNQDAVTKVIDMAPDLINRFLGGKPPVSEETAAIAKETAASYAKSPKENEKHSWSAHFSLKNGYIL